MTGLSDSFQRPINYLRISVTDRCNLRCVYCMPDYGIATIPHSEILSYEEILSIVQVAAQLGITKVRITGGEPLVRLGLAELVRQIASIKSIDDIALTTNGILLSRFAADLYAAGLRRVNVSLDSLQPETFRQITRGRGEVANVLAGIEAAQKAGLQPVKLNMVVMGGLNDNEIIDFARHTIAEDWHVRFIELMPLTTEGRQNARFIPVSEMRRRLASLGELQPSSTSVGNGPAKYFRFPGAKGSIGFITPVSEHFCISCNRLRLTSDGKLRLCLLAEDEVDLKQLLRSGISQAELKAVFEASVARKPRQHHLSMSGSDAPSRPMRQVGG